MINKIPEERGIISHWSDQEMLILKKHLSQVLKNKKDFYFDKVKTGNRTKERSKNMYNDIFFLNGEYFKVEIS